MKTAITLAALCVGLLLFGACAASTPAREPVQHAVSPLDSPLPTEDTAATLVAQPVVTATAVITTATPMTTVVPSPEPPVTETPAPTDTPEPEPEPSDTPEPGPTDTPTATPQPTLTPTVTPTEGPPPTPTPLPNAVFVRDHRSVRSGSDMHVVGEVANGAGSPVYNVTVSAAFFDGSGNLIGASEAPAFLPQTLPTQNNPFKIVLANAPASVSTYDLALRWDDLTALGYDRVTVVSQEVETENGVTIRGELRNDGFAAMSELVVATSFYDANGHVLDTSRGTVAGGPLAPGETREYTVQTGRNDLEFESFLVQAQGIVGR